MALIIRLEGDRDDQNLSYAATFRQGSIGGFKFEVQRRNPEGCEKVAGGFRFAATAGYYLPALRADANQQL